MLLGARSPCRTLPARQSAALPGMPCLTRISPMLWSDSGNVVCRLSRRRSLRQELRPDGVVSTSRSGGWSPRGIPMLVDRVSTAHPKEAQKSTGSGGPAGYASGVDATAGQATSVLVSMVQQCIRLDARQSGRRLPAVSRLCQLIVCLGSRTGMAARNGVRCSGSVSFKRSRFGLFSHPPRCISLLTSASNSSK